jgi:Arc/MetJ-type ribon-helix-helix transcriptional regulator
MGTPKRKAVINAEASQIERVQPLIAAGRYRTLSEFVREAMDEKLQRLEAERMAEAVERYCAAGHAVEDLELIDAQTFDSKPASPKIRGSRRAKR